MSGSDIPGCRANAPNLSKDVKVAEGLFGPRHACVKSVSEIHGTRQPKPSIVNCSLKLLGALSLEHGVVSFDCAAKILPSQGQ